MVAPSLSSTEAATELIRCKRRCLYFIWNFLRIKPDTADNYQPFHPWPAQQQVLDGLLSHKQVILLKARQLGQTTIVLAYALWFAIFWPNRTILLFSKDLKAAKDLIYRLRMMALQLPAWMRPVLALDNRDGLAFANGSRFISFASRASQGDSFTASLAIVDEADLIEDLGTLLGGVKPTISAGGRLVLLSRPDKNVPESLFKKLYRAASLGENGYWPKFLPWNSRPGRDEEWYEKEKRDASSLDWMWEQYPATIEEALAPRQESKRLPLKWLEQCYQPADFRVDGPVAGLPGVRIYCDPVPGRQYVIGVDPAGGKANPNTDLSVSQVLDKVSQEQVAVLASKIEPSILGDYSAQLARYYHTNGRPAGVLVESNNHGHATISYLRNSCPDVPLLLGNKGEVGFTKTDKTKVQVMDLVAETLRCGGCTIHDEQTFHELASIESATNKAPDGLHDDCADAFGIALFAADQPIFKLEIETVDIGNRKPGYSHPKPTGLEEGIHYMDTLNQYSVSVLPVKPLRDGRKRINVGNYSTQEEARHARHFAATLLGQVSPITDVGGELTAVMKSAVERVVTDKLRGAFQL
jgi:hypothetical protein